MTSSRLHRAALWYATKLQWYVIPLHTPIFEDGKCVGCSCEEWKRENIDPEYSCPSPGKHPRMNAWEDRATIDPAQIDKWWNAWPNANVGIAAGKSGLVVLDADLYKEHAGRIPNSETVTSLTGGGGEHLVFLHPVGTPQLGNSKRGLPSYIDVRGWGGQFLAPPSVHPSGNVYQWEEGYGPHQIDPLPLPDDILVPLVAAANELAQVDIHLSGAEAISINDLDVPNLVKAILLNDRSRIDESIITSLVKAGLTDNQILYVFINHAPTDKYNEKNGNGIKYLEKSIAKAKSFIANRPRPSITQQERAA